MPNGNADEVVLASSCARLLRRAPLPHPVLCLPSTTAGASSITSASATFPASASTSAPACPEHVQLRRFAGAPLALSEHLIAMYPRIVGGDDPASETRLLLHLLEPIDGTVLEMQAS